MLKVDDSLSELFRTDTEEFRRYEEIDRRFPSSEYDVLVVVEGKDLLKKPQLEAFRRADRRPAARRRRGRPRLHAVGARQAGRQRLCAADRARRAARRARPTTRSSSTLRDNDIVKGKFLSADGELALVVIALDRKVVQEQSAKVVIGDINATARGRAEGRSASSRT